MADEIINSGGASFTEVIEVAINTGPGSEFDRGLKAMMANYQSFLKEMQAQGVDGKDLLGAQGVGIFANTIRQLQATIKGLRADIREAFTLPADTMKQEADMITDSLEKTAAATENASSKLDQLKAKQAVSDNKAELKGTEEQRARELAAIKSQIEQKSAEETRYNKSIFEMERDREKFTEEARAADLASLKRVILERQKLEADYYANIRAFETEKEARAERTRAAEMAALKSDIIERSKPQQADKLPVSIEDRLAFFEKVRAGGTAAYDALDARHKALFNSILEREDKYRASLKQTQSVLEGNGSAWSRFSAKLLADIPQMAAGVLRFAVAFKLVFAVINSIQAILQYVFVDSFRQGFDYLQKLESRTIDVQEALAKNVTYSKDQATNFKLAGEAAAETAKYVNQMAGLSGVDPEKLEAAFKAMASSGGLQVMAREGKVTRDTLQDMVRLSAMFASSLRSAGISETNQRRLQLEIQQLMQNRVKDSNQLLKSLNLTREQWDAIYKRAKQSGDLMAELQTALGPAADRLLTADQRMESLSKMAARTRDEITGIVAKPLWDFWLDVLRRGIDALTVIDGGVRKIRPEVVEFATAFGTAAANVAKLVVAFGELITVSPVINKGVVGALMALIEAAGLIIDIITTVVKSLTTLAEFLDNPAHWTAKGLKNMLAEIKELGSKAIDDFLGRAVRLRNFVDGTSRPDKKTPAGTANPTSPVGEKGGDRLNDMLAEFRQRVADVKRIEEDYRNEIAEQLAAHQISVAEATDAVMKSITSEQEAVGRLQTEYINAVQASGAATDQKRKAIAGITKDVSELDRALGRLAKTTRIDLTKDQRQQFANDAEAQNQRAKLEAQAELDRAENARREGIIGEEALARAKAEAHNREVMADLVILAMKKSLAGANETERRQIQNQIDLLTQKWNIQRQSDQRDIEAARRSDELAAASAETAEAKRHEADADARLQHAEQAGVLDAREMQRIKVAQAKAHLQAAEAALKEADARLRLSKVNQYNDPRAYEEMQTARAEAQREFNRARFDARNAELGIDPNARRIILGQYNEIQGFGDRLKAAGNALQFFQGTVQNIAQAWASGKASGGILGGIGGVLGSLGGSLSTVGGAIGGSFGKTLGSVSSFLGPIGAITGVIGGLIGGISGLFTRGARNIAKEIGKELGQIMDRYASHQQTLGETIAALERERASAIARLSGHKGGSKELDKILPEIDAQLRQLNDQKNAIVLKFQETASLAFWQNKGDVAGQWVSSWIQINAQVREYLDALKGTAQYTQGVSLANQYLTLELANQRKKLQDQLNDGEQQALQDAVQLNDLLKQRNDLESNYKDQVFEINSADAIERRGPSAVLRGQQLADLKKQHDEQLKQIDDQIRLSQAKVAVEQQLYGFHLDELSLKERIFQLEMQSVQANAEKIRQLQWILQNTANLYPSGGQFFGTPLYYGGSPIPGFYTSNAPPPPPPVTFNGDIYINGRLAPRRAAQDFADEFYNRTRRGLDTR